MQCSFLQRCTNIKVAAVGILYTIHLLSAATMRKHRMLQLVRSVLWLCYVPLFSRMSATTGCFCLSLYHSFSTLPCLNFRKQTKPVTFALKRALTVWRNYPLTLMYSWMCFPIFIIFTRNLHHSLPWLTTTTSSSPIPAESHPRIHLNLFHSW